MFGYVQRLALLAMQPAEARERGASAVEYGLLIAGIAVVIIAIVFTLGGQIHDLFSHTNDCLNGGAAAQTCS